MADDVDGDWMAARKARDYRALQGVQISLEKWELAALDGLINGRIPQNDKELKGRLGLIAKGYAVQEGKRPVRASVGGIRFYAFWQWFIGGAGS